MLERNAQITIMGRIYQEAKKVLVWLGEAADDSDAIFEWMNSPDGGQRTGLGSNWRLLEDTWGNVLLAVSCRPYWRRVWVIQKILGARSLDILCGMKWISIEAFREIISYY